jgi:asparagine synthase
MTEHTGGAEGSAAARALPLTPLERASGYVLGQDQADAALDPAERRDPASALADAIRGPLESGPCYVSYSGGRDSSAVLAIAVATARRHGLSEPIPLTLRFPGVASAEESEWQELLIGQLGLPQWEVIEIHEELDLLGDVARGALRRHGLLWPPNAYVHAPMLERAAGATLLTGLDGDGLLGGWAGARAQQVLHRRVAPGPRDALAVGLALAPRALRRRLTRAGAEDWAPWLRADARRALADAARERRAAEPRRWDRRVAFYAAGRSLRVSRHSLDVLGVAYGVRVCHPMLDPGFLAAVARHGGAGGYGNRTAAMRAIFDGILPDRLNARRGKGEFGRALWRGRARAFAAQWDGAGVDHSLVDPGRLRDAWAAENPPFGSMTLLHCAWLATQG